MICLQLACLLLAFGPLSAQEAEIVLLQSSGTSAENPIVGHGSLSFTLRADAPVALYQFGFDLSGAPRYQLAAAWGMPPESASPTAAFRASWTPEPESQVIRITGRALIAGRWVQASPAETYWRTDPEQKFHVRLVPVGDAYTVRLTRQQVAAGVQKGLLTLIGSPGSPPPGAEPFVPPGQGFRGFAWSLSVPPEWGDPGAVLRPIKPFNLVYAPEHSGFFDQDWRELIRKRIVSLGKPQAFSERYLAYRGELEQRFMAALGEAGEQEELTELEALRIEVEQLRAVIVQLRSLLEGR